MTGARISGPARPWVYLLLFGALLAAGCSTSNTGSGADLVDASGRHPAGFLSTHPGFAVSDVGQCTTCHGSDLTGGISGTSCFTSACHHGTVPNWSQPAQHGASAKRAPGASGFRSCQICHGSDFSGGGSQVTCLNAACHLGAGNTPHPASWRSSDASVHTTTAEANAAVCALCHANGANSPIAPPSPAAPAGTAPGCFNSTLCHGASAVPHPVGAAWVTTPPAAQPHGNDAKALPGTTTGFAFCQICHGTGTDFAGGSSGVSCYPCHAVSAPHPSQWRTGDTYVHTSAAEGNASVCVFCHANGANSPVAPPSPPAPAGTSPGCFNSTLCHGIPPVPHAVGGAWVAIPPAAQPHGNSSNAAPGGTTGFAYCQVCHGAGTDFAGGPTGVSCYPCHNLSAPHPPLWRSGDIYTHTVVNEGNASVCAFCHANGQNSPVAPPSPPAPAGTSPGCFNSTLCHGAAVPAGTHGIGWMNSDNTAAFHGTAAPGPPTCTDCHPIAGHPTCTTCHFDANGSRVSGGFTHVNPLGNHGGGQVGVGNVCENCHQTSRTFRAGSPPSCQSGPGGAAHPGNEGCHADAVINQTLTNPRF